MKLKIRTFLLIVATATINNIAYSQTPYDDFAPSESKKEMLKLPDAIFRVEANDTTLDIRYIEFDKEYFTLKYLDKNNEIIAQTKLEPTDLKWLSIDPLAEKHPDHTPYAFSANNPIRYIDPDGRDWTDANGNVISGDALNNVQVYIFHDNDFSEQAMVQYNLAVERYGAGAVALSNTGTTQGFTTDWGNMSGNINQVMIMTHGKNQSIRVGEGQQFTATGDGKTNISSSDAPNIQDLPKPVGNISSAKLYMYSCHSADKNPVAHGEGDHRQGDLKGTGKPIARVFAETFSFQNVYGTQGAVNYNSFFTNGTPAWSDNYMLPYPEDGTWINFYRPTTVTPVKK